jgi:serine-type anaerobic sulfatase-maturating enzyme
MIHSPLLPTARPDHAPPAFHLLSKPTGAICNLDCAYCFFLAKELLYPGSRFRMADELLEEYVRQLIEAHQSPEVTIAWQGGEPTLMGLDFFKRSIEYARKYARPDQTIQHTIQTNGTLIDDEWAAFFKEHNFLVGISIDGPREMHDVYRQDKGGAPTFDKVMRGLSFLKQHSVEWNALVTLNHANVEHPVDVYRFLRDECGATFIQFIPIVERLHENGVPFGDAVTDRSVTAQQYGQFLIDVFEEWVRHDIAEVYVQMFDVALANWYGEPSGLCVFSKTCGTALALEHNGDLYSCDHFVEPAYRLGNITQTHMIELVASDQQLKFGRDKFDKLPQYCLNCDVRFTCHGGCPKDRFIKTPAGEAGLNYLCAGYKMFFQHIDQPMQLMVRLLRQNRAPAEVMRLYADRDQKWQELLAKTGRNDPCPCGSGQKFKNCHGRERASSRSA